MKKKKVIVAEMTKPCIQKMFRRESKRSSLSRPDCQFKGPGRRTSLQIDMQSFVRTKSNKIFKKM